MHNLNSARRSGLSLTASLVALALAQIAAPAAAQAQDAAAQAQDDATTVVQDETVQNDEGIVVTGSRIRQTPGFDTPTPVVSLSAETLQSSGTTNLTDFLSGYAALQGSSTTRDNSGSNAPIGYTGLNLLDLRNLGTQRTLVLVDGRRHVASVAGSAAIDINTIPTDLVERLEILTGGASAIYGADGVTGVVNFIMKKNFEGITARAQTGISEYGDGGQRLLSITAGKNFSEGRGNIALNYEFGQDDRLRSRDRARSRGTAAVGFFLNPDDPENQSGYTGPNDNGIPDNIPLNDVRYFDTNREGGIDLDFDGFPDYFVGANGALTQFDPGRYIPDFYQQGGNATLISDYGGDFQAKTERHTATALAHFDFSDALTLFAEGKYSRTYSYSLSQPTFDYYLYIPEDNPFIPAALQPQIAANGFGGVLVNRDNFDFGERGEDVKRETWRGVIGLRGKLSDHLNYEASYVYGRSDTHSTYVNDIYDDRFYAAIDAVQGPNGPTCRVNIDPTWTPSQPDNYTREEYPPTSFTPGQCIPFNLFGENVNTQAALDWIKASPTDFTRIEQHVANAYVTGDLGGLFTLPGGPVSFSLGAEWRQEKSLFVPDPIAQQGLTFTNSLATDRGRYEVKEAFGELRIPLFKDRPFFHRLEIGGAARVSDYSTIGGTFSWKVDGAWSPVRDITFAGTYSKAVRAPNIGELFANSSQDFQFITDPCNFNQVQNGSQYRQANCNALLTSLGVADPATYRDSRSTNIPGFQLGNADLSEEEARTWTAGVILQPTFLPGFSLRADWYDITLKNAISLVTPTELAALCVDQATLSNPFCALITRSNSGATAGFVTSFVRRPENVASYKTAGLDVNLNYRLRTDTMGTFTLNVVANYLKSLEFIGTPGADVTDRRQESLYRAPKYTVNADLTWQSGPLTLNYGILWFDKTLRGTNQGNAGNPDTFAPEYTWLKQRWQHDIYASVDVTDRFQLFGGVRNVFGQQPEIGTTYYPVSSLGRYGFVGVKVKLPRI